MCSDGGRLRSKFTCLFRRIVPASSILQGMRDCYPQGPGVKAAECQRHAPLRTWAWTVAGSECRGEGGALGGEELVDALFGEVEHLVELGAGVGVFFCSGLGFD